MILERQNIVNINQLKEQLERVWNVPNVAELTGFIDYYQLCHQAVNEVSAKLENLDEDYSVHFSHNPIHHIETRMKDPGSLAKKLELKHFGFTTAGVRDNIFDIGGIRVVTNYVEDIYTVARNLTAQTDVMLIKSKDYVKYPKASGYRSLHLVISVPVFQSAGERLAPVEIQIRTIGMDLWASLEHKLRYKTATAQQKLDTISAELTQYATDLANIEVRMQSIFDEISEPVQDHEG